MLDANLDGNMYYYSLRSHDEDGEPLTPSTPTSQSPHSSFRAKGQRGPGGESEVICLLFLRVCVGIFDCVCVFYCVCVCVFDCVRVFDYVCVLDCIRVFSF